MAIREFDGVDDRIIVGGTGGAIFNGPFTIILIAKPITLANGEGYMTFRGGGSWAANVADASADKVGFNNTTASTTAATAILTANTWHIFGFTKAAANGQGKVHVKPLGSGSWVQAVGGDSFAAVATSIDEVWFGQEGFGTYKDMRLGAVAVFPTELSDANVQSIQTTPSLQKLADLGATHLWKFNQASTATAVNDLIGNWNQTAITGTTVATGDDPPSFDFTDPSGGAGAPVNTVAPAITGTPTTGQMLTCSTGTWSPAATSYAYQWKRNGTNIGAATASSYLLDVADEGTAVTCTVTATNASGSASATSNTVNPTASTATGSTILIKQAGVFTEKTVRAKIGGVWVPAP